MADKDRWLAHSDLLENYQGTFKIKSQKQLIIEGYGCQCFPT